MNNVEKYIHLIENTEILDFEQTFDTYKACACLINEDKNNAQRLLINILDNRSKVDSNLDEILTQLIESIGFYPYLEKEKLHLTSTDSIIRQEYCFSETLNKYFHDDQKHLLSLLKSDKNVIVSAPTSFGKSLLIEEFISSKIFRNIIVIQPTLALLDETRKKLRKYQDSYKVIIRTSQEPSEEKDNIFLFTAERVNEYQQFPKIDFIVVDEFYKLSSKRDDERADSLNNALSFILKTYNPRFYLLGPNIDGISDGFIEKYNAVFYKTEASLVDIKTIDIYSEHKREFKQPRKFKEYKEEILFDLLLENIDTQSIIYCSSPSRVRYLSNKFLSYLLKKEANITVNNLEIIEWIKENISEKWSLITLLNNKIGIHDGALQKHITSSIIDYFNNGLLNFLFCTTTIIEGVNTSAKNIIFFDKKKGGKIPIDFFDYSNIKGRAGRLMVHYTGNIFNFNPVPSNEQVIIDIPFYEQNPISPEILINLDEHEIKDKNSSDYLEIKKIPTEEKELYKKNATLVYGQKNIIDTLRNDLPAKHHLIYWDRFPKKEQLEYLFTLAKNHLLKPSETFNPMTIPKLVFVTQNYSINRNLEYLINNQIDYLKNNGKSEDEAREEAIRDVFQILKHWFQYKIPKWLAVLDSLQRFVCSEKGLRAGNYSYFSSLIENDFLRENLTILSEYGVPSSAIRKLENLIPSDLPQDKVVEHIRNKKIIEDNNFLDYEKIRLQQV